MKNKSLFDFNEIIIDEKYKYNSDTIHILSKIPNNPKIIYTQDVQKLIKDSQVIYNPKEKSRKLLLTGIKGKILRKCPGSLGHICCNYYVINLYIGCPINCSYCILQSYINNPFTTINVNLDEIFNELELILKKNEKKNYRIGTGELGDSLVYDRLTDYSIKLIDFFSYHKNSIFEFKTKTNFIEKIVNRKSPGNIVIGFSINPQSIIDVEEENSSSLEERLTAAKKAVNMGYKISLHFDPIVNSENFKKEYFGTIKKIFDYISADDIAWISLGTFRYTRELKKIMEYNYPWSKLLYDEFVECRDSKFRYFKPIRTNLYKTIIDFFNNFSTNLPIYMCMESPEVWTDALKTLPDKKKLSKIF